MKKTIAISALFVLALGLAGCQTPAQPEVKVPDKEAATEATTADQKATLEVTEGGEAVEQQASLTITEPTDENAVQQEATLTISEGAVADPATAQQEASLTISE